MCERESERTKLVLLRQHGEWQLGWVNEVGEVVHGSGPQSERADRDRLGVSRLVALQIDPTGIEMKEHGLKEGLFMAVGSHTVSNKQSSR